MAQRPITQHQSKTLWVNPGATCTTKVYLSTLINQAHHCQPLGQLLRNPNILNLVGIHVYVKAWFATSGRFRSCLVGFEAGQLHYRVCVVPSAVLNPPNQMILILMVRDRPFFRLKCARKSIVHSEMHDYTVYCKDIICTMPSIWSDFKYGSTEQSKHSCSNTYLFLKFVTWSM